MDNVILMFLAFSATVTMSSEVLKNLIKIYFPNVKVGLILAVGFGLATSLTYGTGLLGGMFGIEYTTAWYEFGFRLVDLIMSGLIYSLSSKAIVTLWERGQGKEEPKE